MATDADREHDGGSDEARKCLVEVWPHRSLDRNGQWALHGAIAVGFCFVVARNTGPAVVPIAVACVATYLVFAFALWHNNRAARLVERIEITPETVRVERQGPAAKARTEEFKTSWVRVVEIDDRRVANRLALRESGRSIAIGEFLSATERAALAAELRGHLERMKRCR